MRLKKFSLPIGAQVFKACSDEARIRILNLIFKNGEMCISDLERILDFTQAKTSRHVIYLKNSGILSSKKFEKWMLYYVKEEMMEITGRLLDFVEKDMTLRTDIENYNTMSSNRALEIDRINSRKKYIS
ncbi:MAG: ArsR/SmtB family transcription factor [Candidatus Cyclobacteriaceae bacterium M2_1C_046]